MQTWMVSGLWFCGRLWRLKINISRCLVHIRKSNVRSQKLEVQETDFSLTQFDGIWNYFSWCRFTHGRNSSSWSLGLEVLHSVPNRTDGPKREPWRNPSAVVKPNIHNPISIKHTNVIPTNIDNIPSNTTNSGSSTMLYVFEDNEAVIKMIIEGRSPTMRHVSRTHRELLLIGCLTRSIWIPEFKSSMSTPNTNFQTYWPKGNFTRDDWNNLPRLFNRSHFSSHCCAQNFSFSSCPRTMAKRIQEQKEQDRIVAKIKATAMNLSSTVSASCSSVNHPIASQTPEILKASAVKLDERAEGWQMHTLTGSWIELQGKPAATARNYGSFSNLNPGAITRKMWRGKLLRPEIQENSDVSSSCTLHGECLFDRTTNLRPKSSGWLEWLRCEQRCMEYIHERHTSSRSSSWSRLFGEFTIFQESWSLGNSYSKWLKRWSRIRQKLIVWPRLITKNLRGDRRLCCVTELLRLWMPKLVSCSVWEAPVTNQPKLGRPKWNGIWKVAISKIWIESMESRWSSSGKFHRIHYMEHSRRDSNFDRITVWTWAVQWQDHPHVNVQRHCMVRTRKHRKLGETFRYSYELCSQIPARTLVIFGPGSEKKWYGTYSHKPNGEWDTTAEGIMLNLAESGHPKFRATGALERADIRSKGKGKKSIHFNGIEENIELILRTVISVRSSSSSRLRVLL